MSTAGKVYRQCRLRRGTAETTGWIEARGAKVGARVELLVGSDDVFDPELWEVVAVYGPALDGAALREHQRLHRGSLPSVERMQ